MQPRRVEFGHEARKKLWKGLELASRMVAPTLGPSGRLVVMDSRFGTPEVATSAIDKAFDSPVLGNDGLAIVSEVHIGDPFVNQGIALAREAGRMTKRTAGDGSTTAIVLTAGLVREGMSLLAAGFEPRNLEVAFERALAEALARLLALAVPVSDERTIERVALRAGGGDVELAEAVGSAVALVGSNAVQVERSNETGVSVEVREGLRLDRGAMSPYFLPAPERSQAVLSDCYVLIVNDKIATARELLTVVERVREADRPLLVLAHELDADALALLTVNNMNGRLNAVAVQAPAYGEARRSILEDIAALTGGLVVGNGAGVSLSEAGLRHLGQAREVVVGRKSTTIVGCEGKEDRARLRQLETDLRDAGSVYERDELDRRRVQLTGSRFAVLKVGAQTDSESQERTRRAEDALRASQSALREGVVPGGGIAFLLAGDADEPNSSEPHERAARHAVRRGLEEPLRVLAANAGEDPARVVASVRSLSRRHGFNVETSAYEDVVASGIVDPVSVGATALRSAAFVARRTLLVEAVVAQPLSGGRLRGMAAEGGPANISMQ
jgi:chaperonin GroEL